MSGLGCRLALLRLAIPVACLLLAPSAHAAGTTVEAPEEASSAEPGIEAEAEAAVEAELKAKAAPKPKAEAAANSEIEAEASDAEAPPLPDVGLDAPVREPPSEVDELTVRERPRDRLLRDLPEAVTGFSADDLEMRAISNLSEIANSTPSLVLDRMAGSANSARIFIRGIGQDDAISTADPSVGLYVDGVYMGRSFGALMDLFDLQSVQVLRGPQSRPFGRNSIGGAINLVSMMPSFGRDIEARLGFGSDGYRQGKLIVDLPLVEDTLAARVSLIGTRSEGYTEDRLFDQNMDNENLNGGRLTLQWMPSESLNIVTHLDHTREKTGSVGFELYDLHVRPDLPDRASPTYAPLIEASASIPTFRFTEDHPQFTIRRNVIEEYPNLSLADLSALSVFLTPNGQFYDFPEGSLAGAPACISALGTAEFQTPGVLDQVFPDQIDDEIHSVEPNVESRTDLAASGATVIGTLQLPFAELKSISGWKAVDGNYNLDIDGTKYTGISGTPRQDQWQFSQELQLSGDAVGERFEWLAGVFWFQEKTDDRGSLGLFSEVSAEVRCSRARIAATAGHLLTRALVNPDAAFNDIRIPVDFDELRPFDEQGNPNTKPIPGVGPIASSVFNVNYGGLYNALVRAIAGCPVSLPFSGAGPDCNALTQFFPASQVVDTIRDLQDETDVDTQNNTENISYSGYLWGRWNFTDRLSFSSGVRYSYDHKDLFRNSSYQPSGKPILADVSASGHWSDWSPSFVLQYRYSNDVMGYLKAAKGYKPGGFNGRSICPGNPVTIDIEDCGVAVAEKLLVPFEPETSWTYELGVRSTWLDERLVLDGTLFYNVYDHRQVSQVRFVGGDLQSDTINAGPAIIQGVELEAQASPWSGLDLDLSVSVTNGRYLDFPDAIRNPDLDPFDFNNPALIEAVALLFGVPELLPGDDLHMKDLPMFKGSIGISYEHQLSELGILRHWVGYRYQSRIFYNTENTLMQGGYGIFDARVAFESLEGNWGASIYVKNLLNREYIQNGIDLRETVGFATVQYGAPRFVGVEFQREF